VRIAILPGGRPGVLRGKGGKLEGGLRPTSGLLGLRTRRVVGRAEAVILSSYS